MRLYYAVVRLELELAVRFLRRRTGVLLRGTALAALFGVGLAATALVITLALMTGYIDAIGTALQRGNAHVVGFAPAPVPMALGEARGYANRIAELDGVRLARPVTYLMGLIEDPQQPASPLPVVLKAVSEPPEFTSLDTWPSTQLLPAVIG
jgi:ABC-type lipoprotein release transport system permease subunit